MCAVSAAGAQTTSLDREVKTTLWREMYTSMCADCTVRPNAKTSRLCRVLSA
jgi:hypothetical protein